MYYYTTMDYNIKLSYYESETNKKWFEERNKQIYKDKLSGMSNKDLVIKFNLSPARIQGIINKERSKHEFKR
jgi:Mor family transcriptional regulator